VDSSSLWTGASLALGIIMIFFIGLLLTLLSIPLAKGTMRAHEYNYRSVQLFKLSNEEKDRLGKPTAIAAIGIAMLYVLGGLASVALGTTGNAGPIVLYLFMGTIILSILGLLAITIVSPLLAYRARKKSAVK
jgi:hypothetical protein